MRLFSTRRYNNENFLYTRLYSNENLQNFWFCLLPVTVGSQLACCEEWGLNQGTLSKKLKRGPEPEKAVAPPPPK